MKFHSLVILLVIFCTSCSVMCTRQNKLKNTRWTCDYQEFVADVGNESVTVTLRFVSDREYVLETVGVTPSHPAMYMNPDGTVDTLPGHTWQYTSQGTYTVKKNEIVLTDKEGGVHTLQYVADILKSDDLSYRPLVFTREKE